MHRFLLPALCLLCAAAIAQSGSLQIEFTPHNGGKSMRFLVATPFFKFDNPHGYWFINPHNGDRHLQLMPDRGWGDKKADVAFITINEKENAYSFYDGGSNDSSQLTIKNNFYMVSAPEYDRALGEKNKPLHISINNFAAGECSFTISGEARLATINDNSWVTGTVQGTAHFYRQPVYEKSDQLPGCDCDPVIYASLYDPENNLRTMSACENALRNKIFDAVQQAMAPLFSKVAYSGTGVMKAGEIGIVVMPGHTDIKVPVKDRPACSGDYRHNGITGAASHKTIFSNEDGYGLRFLKMPDAAILNGGSADPGFAKKQAAFMEASVKQVAAGKMTAAQFEQAQRAFMLKETGNGPIDYKQMEIEHNLTVEVLLNPIDREMMLVKLGDKNNTKILHTVKQAAYEVFSPQIKDSDGSWIPNRWFIYAGAFDKPVPGKSSGGFDAEISNARYPPAGNKLSIYSIIVKLEGDKSLADKAIANINFDALFSLITKQ